jgi:hypothetical protein
MIHKRSCWCGLVVVLTVSLGAGCSKSDSKSPNPGSSAATSSILHAQSATNTVPALRFHWLGKKRLAAEANATNFMAIWNLPESAKLEAQTLDKLASAPWRLLKAATALSNAPTDLLRPLLDDLVQEESYLEVAAATNQPAELVFAIRLPAARAALWQTNLAQVLESLSGVKLVREASGWALRKHDAPDFWQLTHAGDWTLLGAATGTNNSLLGEFHRRLAAGPNPYPTRDTNYWVELDANLAALGPVLKEKASFLTHLKHVTLFMAGDGTNARTHADVIFNQPLGVDLTEWMIPTNIISDELISFTAARLPAPARLTSIFGHELPDFLVPRQVFVWALRAFPMASYVALPDSAGNDLFHRFSQDLLTKANIWIASNSVGAFTGASGGNSVVWQGTPNMSAFLQKYSIAEGQFIVGGLAPTALTNPAPNLQLLKRMVQRNNLVYYDWEFAGPRVETWFYMGQLARLLLGRQQLPQDSLGALWLKSLAPSLANAGTVGVMPSPDQIAFDRFATLGLTSFELHLFADWLESPNFPLGTHTTAMPVKPLLRRKTPVPLPN